MSTSVLLGVDHPTLAGQVRAMLTGHSIRTLRISGDTVIFGDAEPDQGITHVALTNRLDIAWQVRAEMPLCRLIFLLNPTQTSPDLRLALRAGIDEVARVPDDLPNLPQMIAALQDKAADATGQQSILLAVYSGTGGLGRTTLACTLAKMYANMGFRTLLMDLNMAIGGVETVLGITPPTTLANLLPVMEELDPGQLATATVQHQEHLDVLCSPGSSEISGQFGVAQADRLLTVARRSHQVTVLDMPTTLSPSGLAQLRHADQIAYLLTADPLAVHTLASVISAFEQGGIASSRVGIVHRLRGPAVLEIAGGELVSQCGLSLLGTLPHDWSLAYRSQVGSAAEAGRQSPRYDEAANKLSVRLALTCGLPAQAKGKRVKAKRQSGVLGFALPPLLKGGLHLGTRR